MINHIGSPFDFLPTHSTLLRHHKNIIDFIDPDFVDMNIALYVDCRRGNIQIPEPVKQRHRFIDPDREIVFAVTDDQVEWTAGVEFTVRSLFHAPRIMHPRIANYVRGTVIYKNPFRNSNETNKRFPYRNVDSNGT